MCETNTNPLPLTHPQTGTWPTTQTWALTGNWTLAFPLSYTSESNIYWFYRERKAGIERGRETLIWERNIDQLPLVCDLTKDRICNLVMYPDQESNPWPLSLWDNAPTNWTTSARVRHCCFFNSSLIIKLNFFMCIGHLDFFAIEILPIYLLRH